MHVRQFSTLAALIGCAALSAAPCAAQSLHGSLASVKHMYHEARREGFTFFSTPSSVRKAVAAGYLVRLAPNGNFTLHDVSYPFVRPAVLTFVDRLGTEYRNACGETLEITSAVRPASLQLPNSVARTVHPTGMAVDLHKSSNRACRAWLRETLLELERTGVLEATEEFSPPHFHVAVYPAPYTRYVAKLADASTVRLASNGEVDLERYRVREGDTLWDIAREHDTSVHAIKLANDLDGSLIQPGDTLLIPSRR